MSGDRGERRFGVQNRGAAFGFWSQREVLVGGWRAVAGHRLRNAVALNDDAG